ncbi:mitochondrial small ribosomal subunit protein uS17m [Candidatus Collierbacteria bacterium]|nr:mitochondrial small ribosomal subunit protein uS17m [Candidatus Collierbacteria bacterium]
MKKQFKGTVTSTKMAKTVAIKVNTIKVHPKYLKRTKWTASYLAHDPLGVKVGDQVIIESVRPISKHKHWQITKVITSDK